MTNNEIRIFIFLICTFFATSLDAKIKFTANFSNALKQARAEGKIVYVHVTASWCGPCKKMEKEVYTDKTVSEFFNNHFVAVKLDEKYNIGFLSKNNIRSFPTLIYFSPFGDELKRFRGYRPANYLLGEANNITSKHDYSKIKINLEEMTPGKIAYMLDSLSGANNNKAYRGLLNIYIKEEVLKNKNLDIKPFYHHFSNIEKEVVKKILKKNKKLDLKNNSLVESVAINYLLNHSNPFSPASINDVLQELAESKIKNHKQVKAYLYAYQSFYLNTTGSQSEELKLIASKSLVTNYAETSDINMLYIAISTIVVKSNEKALMENLIQELVNRIELDNQYYFHDLVSLVEYKLGRETQAVESIKLANDLATPQKVKFIPLVNRLKPEIEVLKD
jgi:thiol-disulfide isomerase/thioredoxin